MKKILLYLFIAIIGASAAGGLYLYTIKADQEPQVQEKGNVNGEVVDETIVPDKPTEFFNGGEAPKFAGLTDWQNIGEEKELKTEDLRGKIVLVNFWTYSCIDCTKAIPFITKWNNMYKDRGLIVIGIHTPQFAFEKVPGNVANAVKGFNIPYPVALDNNYKTWIAYHNQFWPASYLIDRDGRIVYSQIGGGKYGATEKAIRTLLGLEGEFKIPEQSANNNPDQTEDIYTGLTKLGKSYGGSEDPETDAKIYVFPKKLPSDKFALEGSWQFNQESVTHTKGYGRLLLNFNAAQAYIVAESPEPVTIKVYIDDVLIKGIVVKDRDVYQIFDSLTPDTHTLRLEVPNETLQIFSFTFS